MKADLILKNARIYTVDDAQPWAEAAVIRDGKFIFVGSDEEAEKYEGPVKDAGRKFVLPGLIDAHCHPGFAGISMNQGHIEFIKGESKAEILDYVSKYVKDHPGMAIYDFYLNNAMLQGEKLTRDELDAICSEIPIHIEEVECHSCWVNTPEFMQIGLDEYEPDMVPELSYAERDEKGRIDGRIFEFMHFPIKKPPVSIETYEQSILHLVNYWKKTGIIAGFDAGQPTGIADVENFFRAGANLAARNELPMYIESSLMVFQPSMVETAADILLAFNEKYGSEFFYSNTMKLMMDGTFIGRTAAMMEPYADCPKCGRTNLEKEALVDWLIELNEKGLDFHVHTVGDRSVTTVLDAVEAVKEKIGEDFIIQVTCAHLECMPDSQLGRFKKLGVIADFTPHWHGGNSFASPEEIVTILGEKRAGHLYRANAVWNTGATVCFSSDHVGYDNMKLWNPYMGIEVGITRQDNRPDAIIEDDFSQCPPLPRNEEKLSMAQMIKGFTLNAAKQMRLDDKIGSIEAGKEASFLIFENNLFDIDPYQIHRQLPEEVYIRGEIIS